ncbi:MAG: amidohydrolase [Ilumatobacter sp.]|nr:amidohydrolase [Ilumatobacter sp.]
MTSVERPAAAAPSPDDSLRGWLAEHSAGLIALRRNIHAHPELSGAEHATTELVRERLELAGLTPRIFAIGTGLACDLRPDGADGRPVLALRADLDALAMDDEKDVPYRSQVAGASHACGHDVHTAVVLGTAMYFANHRDELPGPLRLLFQPAEERVPGGALDVIADGGLDGVDAIVGVHCEPKLDVGVIGVKSGSISSAADMLEIRLSGPGGHTARPELTVNLLAVAARVVAELPQRVADALELGDEVKLVFGSVHGGDAANVIPTNCVLRASVRTPTLAVWEGLPRLVERIIGELLADTGAGFEVDYTHGVPPVVNDGQITDVVRRAATGEFGPDAVVPVAQSWGGDDFAWLLREVPGSYVRLGVHDTGRPGEYLDLHVGHFDVDERAIALGVRLLVATVREYFATPA